MKQPLIKIIFILLIALAPFMVWQGDVYADGSAVIVYIPVVEYKYEFQGKGISDEAAQIVKGAIQKASVKEEYQPSKVITVLGLPGGKHGNSTRVVNIRVYEVEKPNSVRWMVRKSRAPTEEEITQLRKEMGGKSFTENFFTDKTKLGPRVTVTPFEGEKTAQSEFYPELEPLKKKFNQTPSDTRFLSEWRPLLLTPNQKLQSAYENSTMGRLVQSRIIEYQKEKRREELFRNNPYLTKMETFAKPIAVGAAFLSLAIAVPIMDQFHVPIAPWRWGHRPKPIKSVDPADKTLLTFHNNNAQNYIYEADKSHCDNGTITDAGNILTGPSSSYDDETNYTLAHAYTTSATLISNNFHGADCTVFFRGLKTGKEIALHVHQSLHLGKPGEVQAEWLYTGVAKPGKITTKSAKSVTPSLLGQLNPLHQLPKFGNNNSTNEDHTPEPGLVNIDLGTPDPTLLNKKAAISLNSPN